MIRFNSGSQYSIPSAAKTTDEIESKARVRTQEIYFIFIGSSFTAESRGWYRFAVSKVKAFQQLGSLGDPFATV